MTTFFDLLAEHYGPSGEGFDPDNPFFRALWELKNILCEDMTCFADGKHGKGIRTSHLHPEYVRRSRAEAALLLPEAARIMMTREYWCLIPDFSRWYIKRLNVGGGWTHISEDDNLLDALSAALLAKEGVKTDA